jgi:hypothetical protein
MGWETLAFVALEGLSARETMKSAKKEAKAVVAEGNINMKNKAKEVARKTASLTTSFLSSGLAFEGTPQNVVNSVFDSGIEDLELMATNYNTKSKNIISSARTEALSGLASSFMGASFGSDIGSSIGNPFGGQGGLMRLWDTGDYGFIGPLKE